MPTPRPRFRDELLVAFRLYCRTPFGKLHQHNPEIVELARLLARTPSAVGMKACNFASRWGGHSCLPRAGERGHSCPPSRPDLMCQME